jgi:hypothetical protein
VFYFLGGSKDIAYKNVSSLTLVDKKFLPFDSRVKMITRASVQVFQHGLPTTMLAIWEHTGKKMVENLARQWQTGRIGHFEAIPKPEIGFSKVVPSLMAGSTLE